MTIKYSEISQNLQGQKDPIQEIFFLPLMTRVTESGLGGKSCHQYLSWWVRVSSFIISSISQTFDGVSINININISAGV